MCKKKLRIPGAVKYFKSILNDEPDVSPAIAALKVLLDFMSKDTCKYIFLFILWVYNL